MKRIIGSFQDTMLLWEVLDGLHLPAFSMNGDFMITDCNATVKNRLFFQKNEIINLSVFDIIRMSPSIQRDALKKKSSALEGRCLRKDRETFPARISFVKHSDGFIVVVEDRSEFIEIETRARHRKKVKQIELINEIGSVINSSLSIGHIFRLVFSEIKKMIDFDRASINLLEEHKNVLKIFAIDTKRPTRLTKGVISPTDKTSAGWVTINQKPWINRDLQKEIAFSYDSVLLGEGIRSTISVPLYKDRPLGALNFDSISPEKYSEKDLGILLPIAKHLSVALENALLFEEISKEKREWEKTFDAITDIVWIEDLNGKVLRVNKAVIEKSGKAEISLIQKSSGEIFNILQIADVSDLSLESVECKKKLFKEVKGLNGRTYYFWTYPLLNSDGNIYGVVNYLKEVTEQKKLEQQLVRADKLASLGMLVAGVVHEINNPLGIIAGYSEALMDRAGDPELRAVKAFEDFPEYLETINNEIFRCKDRLKGLLDFARTSSGNYRKIDINGLIKEVTLLVKHGARTHNNRIELDLQRDIPETVADPGAMRQLLINIIMNSLYVIDTEGEIVISTSYVKDPCFHDSICIKISDNGKGISRDIVDKIFDPFFSTKDVGEGTGLGLSICHRIVSEHGGTIDVESKEGIGTTFLIKLPVRGKKCDNITRMFQVRSRTYKRSLTFTS